MSMKPGSNETNMHKAVMKKNKGGMRNMINIRNPGDPIECELSDGLQGGLAFSQHFKEVAELFSLQCTILPSKYPNHFRFILQGIVHPQTLLGVFWDVYYLRVARRLVINFGRGKDLCNELKRAFPSMVFYMNGEYVACQDTLSPIYGNAPVYDYLHLRKGDPISVTIPSKHVTQVEQIMAEHFPSLPYTIQKNDSIVSLVMRQSVSVAEGMQPVFFKLKDAGVWKNFYGNAKAE